MSTSGRRPSVGERLERSYVGRAVITTAIAIVAFCVVAWNLPAGRLHDKLANVASPVVQALGLEQDWALFAPNPRDISVGVFAVIHLRDGRTERWVPPHNGLVVTPYRTYRWQKYVERLRADDYGNIWEPTSQWLVRTHGGSTRVREVDLVRTFRSVVVPGSGLKRPDTSEYLFYRYVVPR